MKIPPFSFEKYRFLFVILLISKCPDYLAQALIPPPLSKTKQ